MRDDVVGDLVREVLGPRQGINELLSDNPLDEYVTGVLAPLAAERAQVEVDIEAKLSAEEYSRPSAEPSEDDLPEPEPLPHPFFGPVLDPQSRPHSMGISFTAQSSTGQPGFQLCLTWARYEPCDEGWSRMPRVALIGPLRATQLLLLGADGARAASEEQAEIALHLLMRQQERHQWFVAAYIENRVRVPENEHPSVEHHVFQPQIRVNCEPDTQVVSGEEGGTATEDEENLRFLFRKRPTMAQGRLCSAIWRDLDPEQQLTDTVLGHHDAMEGPPFCWVDGALLEADQRKEFSPPDVRTEFVPVYSVVSPALGWHEQFGTPPELRAEELAETWSPDALRERLEPLPNGYSMWINSLRAQTESDPTEARAVADRLIARCEVAVERIRRGIELLVRDEEARLAFCFAMKAMAVQTQWPVGATYNDLTWYPFQLAFILLSVESIADRGSPDRAVCDLLWVPTGAGKTEAYLALSAFTIALRRRRAMKRTSGDTTGAGVAVISRYTLRLLTIQQFRRALRMVTACELLRVHGLGSQRSVGWRPAQCALSGGLIWGCARFSVGLWVGGSVTPNRLRETWSGRQMLPGALGILGGQHGEGEPAQILRCPACDSILSVPQRDDGGLPAGTYDIHLVLQGDVAEPGTPTDLNQGQIEVTDAKVTALAQGNYRILTVRIGSPANLVAEELDSWWQHVRELLGDVRLAAARASRPGYYVRWYKGQKRQQIPYDFEICCPNPSCPLCRPWLEGLPFGSMWGTRPGPDSPSSIGPDLPRLTEGTRFACVNEAFKQRQNSLYIADRIPIPALTVDEQVYQRCPSMVIATVDKFARPAFEPRASALFGNIDHHHCIVGYYRYPVDLQSQHPDPVGTGRRRNYVSVAPLDPPDLVIQDELHLIEGPLGSLVGLYEAAFDLLCSESSGHPVKYIASSATVRQAEEQVRSVFGRDLATFPPAGLTVDDSFFLRSSEHHPLDEHPPGRLYVGICAPGRGPLTPVVRIWSRLLQTAWEARTSPDIDPFWTLVGYFNAIRELAGARALYRQDIVERISRISSGDCRSLPEHTCQELSGRTPSTELPSVLSWKF